MQNRPKEQFHGLVVHAFASFCLFRLLMLHSFITRRETTSNHLYGKDISKFIS